MEKSIKKFKLPIILTLVATTLILFSIFMPILSGERYYATGYKLAEGRMYITQASGHPNDVLIFEEPETWFAYPIFYFALFSCVQALVLSILSYREKDPLGLIFGSGIFSIMGFILIVMGLFQAYFEYFGKRGYGIGYGLLCAIIGLILLALSMWITFKSISKTGLKQKLNEIRDNTIFYMSLNFSAIGILFCPLTLIFLSLFGIVNIRSSFNDYVISYFILSFICGILALIIGIIWKEKEPRVIYSRILGFLVVSISIIIIIILIARPVEF